MLRGAFNTVIRLNSREAVLKRFDVKEYTSRIRISPSRVFKIQDLPSDLISRSREFIIPVDSILGTQTIKLTFSAVPSTGQFDIGFGTLGTLGDMQHTATAADIQAGVRSLPGLELVEVTGNFTSGFTFAYHGWMGQETGITIPATSLDAVITVGPAVYVPWPGRQLKRGDRIEDSVLGSMAVNDISEMTDLGGATIGFRARVE